MPIANKKPRLGVLNELLQKQSINTRQPIARILIRNFAWMVSTDDNPPWFVIHGRKRKEVRSLELQTFAQDD